MNEVLQTIFPDWLIQNIHPAYVVIIWFITEWVRYKFNGVDKKIAPKNLVLVVGLVVGACLYFGEGYLEDVVIPFRVLILSYFISTFAYDFVVKPIKAKFFPWLDEKQKQ